MRVFFLSDLHLSDGASAAAKRFERFLQSELKAGDLLVLGGDIFDLFVGNKEVFRLRFRGVLAALNGLGAREINTYYLEGNHDFHLRGVFPPGSGINLVADSFALSANGSDLWISHGDLIDPEDRGYRFLRWFTRLGVVRMLLRLLPGTWIDGIGRRSSRESRKYHNTERGGAKNHDRLRRLYLEYAQKKARDGYRHVLVGHSHLRDHIHLDGGEYLNLGFSADTLVFGLLEEGRESFEIRQYS